MSEQGTKLTMNPTQRLPAQLQGAPPGAIAVDTTAMIGELSIQVRAMSQEHQRLSALMKTMDSDRAALFQRIADLTKERDALLVERDTLVTERDDSAARESAMSDERFKPGAHVGDPGPLPAVGAPELEDRRVAFREPRS